MLGLAGDLKKAMKDGKPIIIENKDSHTKDRESGTLVEDSVKPVENILDNATEQSQSASANDAENTMSYSVPEGTVDERDASQTEVTDCSRSTSVAEIASGPQGEVHKDSELQSSNSYKKEKSATEPIIVPIVLKMSEFDHKALLEEWITTRTIKDKCLVQVKMNMGMGCGGQELKFRTVSVHQALLGTIRATFFLLILQDQNKLISNLKIIQEYLCSFESQCSNNDAADFVLSHVWSVMLPLIVGQGMTVVNISATTFPQTLDRLHSYLLQVGRHLETL
ncbi:hypothetical protein BHE74_00020474 [Ensete ventricosum]|nr:hypothetical protein BHE74_00020474 [Ensete ventricosum]